MLYAIIYPKNSDNSRFSDLKKRFKNNYVMNKEEYPMTVTAVQSLLLKYQKYYNSNRKFQFQVVVNQLMFTQRVKTGNDEGES